jgi:NADH-quinone oxidoreductase subunit C
MDLDTLRTDLAALITGSHLSHGMPVLELPAAALLPVVQRLKTQHGCALLLDITAVDHPQRQPRFDVVYHLLSPATRSRVRLKLAVSEAEPVVATLTGLYGSARFLEREAHEMYGIRFAGNDDLRPILLYEGFVGHPLRKDYPQRKRQPLIPMKNPNA